MILLVSAVGRPTCASDTDLEKQMRQGMQTAEKLLPNWTIRARYFLDPSNELSSTVAVLKGTKFLEEGFDPEAKMQVLKVMNDEYAFTLSKSKESSKYSLTLVVKRDDPDYAARIDDEISGIYFTALSTHYIFGWLSWDLVQHPDFRVDSISLEQDLDSNFVKCDFSFTPQSVPKGYQKRDIFGYMKFDPKANWAIVEYEVKGLADSADSLRRRVAYSLLESRLPVTTLVTARAFGPKYANDSFQTNIKLHTLDESEISENEFYLSHYGLPEPTFNKSWLGPWFWYLVVGIGCVATGRLILRRRQSRV